MAAVLSKIAVTGQNSRLLALFSPLRFPSRLVSLYVRLYLHLRLWCFASVCCNVHVMMWKPCSIRMGLRRCLIDPMSVVAALPRLPASSLFPTVNQSSFFLAFSRTHTSRALRKGGSASKLKAQVAATTSTDLQESDHDLLTHLPNFAIGTVSETLWPQHEQSLCEISVSGQFSLTMAIHV